MLKTNTIGWIALVLVVVGALNWGLVGLFGFNLVSALFGEMTILSRLVYVLVGISSLILIGESVVTLQHRHHPGHPAHM